MKELRAEGGEELKDFGSFGTSANAFNVNVDRWKTKKTPTSNAEVKKAKGKNKSSRVAADDDFVDIRPKGKKTKFVADDDFVEIKPKGKKAKFVADADDFVEIKPRGKKTKFVDDDEEGFVPRKPNTSKGTESRLLNASERYGLVTGHQQPAKKSKGHLRFDNGDDDEDDLEDGWNDVEEQPSSGNFHEED